MGRPSFLRAECRRQEQQWRMCQCPEWGDLHFYIITTALTTSSCSVSMPWKRRPSFLHYLKRCLKRTECVSMPWMGRPSFLPDDCCTSTRRSQRCVNALNGATFISTLASGNPCKSRLCGSIFPEVFQNILKKAFLNGVFWKFTICSYLTVPFLLLVYLFFLGLRSTYSTLLIG